jgi:hypothetical protein
VSCIYNIIKFHCLDHLNFTILLFENKHHQWLYSTQIFCIKQMPRTFTVKTKQPFMAEFSVV